MSQSRSRLIGHPVWEVFPCLVDLPFRVRRDRPEGPQKGHGIVFEDYCPKTDCWFEYRCYTHRAGLAIYFQKVPQEERHVGLGQLVERRTAQLQQMFDFNTLLKRITDSIRDSAEDAQILKTVIGELGKGLGLSYGSATLHTIDTLEDNGATACEYIPTGVESQSESKLNLRSAPIIQSVYPRLSECQAVQLCHRHPSLGWQLVLACPIVSSQGLLGDLWLFWPADREVQYVSPQEVALVQHAADQCAIAIRQVHLHKAAQNQVEVLESLHQQKDDFLSAVSHELRSPVTNMKMAIQMLTMSFEKLQDDASAERQPVSAPPAEGSKSVSMPSTTSKVQQYLQILSGECDREISLINDLLDLQRLDSGAPSPSIGLINLESWLAGITQSFEERMQTRQQTLQFRCLSPLTPFRTDVTAVHRILTELLDNAYKYTPPGETILVTVRMIDRTLQLQVTNSGVEISASHLPYVFDKFYRVQNNTLWQKGGTGLGLALVKQLTHQLEGTVQVYSQQGRTSFRLMIPESSPVLSEGSPIA